MFPHWLFIGYIVTSTLILIVNTNDTQLWIMFGWYILYFISYVLYRKFKNKNK